MTCMQLTKQGRKDCLFQNERLFNYVDLFITCTLNGGKGIKKQK